MDGVVVLFSSSEKCGQIYHAWMIMDGMGVGKEQTLEKATWKT